MNPYLLGGWPAIQSFAEGIQTQTAFFNLFSDEGNMGWFVWAMVLVGASISVIKFLKEKRASETLWIVWATVWISMVFSPVSVGLPTPAFSPNMEASVQAAKLDLQHAEAWLEKAKAQTGQLIEQPSVAVQQAQADLARLEVLAGQNNNGKIGVVSSVFGFIFNVANSLAVNVWEAIDSVAWNDVSLVDRMGQAAIARQLSFQPGLSPAQKQVAENLAACLKAKQVYSQQLVKVSGWVKEGVHPAGRSGLTGEALEAAWTDVLLPSRQQAEDVCYGADDALYSGIDASITEEEVQSFTHAFSVGGIGFWEAENEDKRKSLAAEIGVKPEQLEGRSPEQIAKMFLRSKKMAAISSELQDRLEVAGSGMVPRGQTGVKADAGTWMAEWVGGFAQSALPFVKDTMDLCLKFVVGFFPVAFLLSLIPGGWKKAMFGYLFALMFVLGWQVMWLTLEKHSAEEMRVEIAAQGGSGSVMDTTSRLLAGTWDNLTGDAGAGDVVAGGALAGRAAATNAGRQALQFFLAAAKSNPPGAVISTIGSGVVIAASAGAEASDQLERDQQNFDQILRGEIGVSPALRELASGGFDVQRAELKAKHDRNEMNRAIWMMASPFLTLIFLLGGWGVLATAAGMAGPMVSQIGQGVSSTVGGALTRGIGGRGTGGMK